ncbi:MAG TPA: Arm DNA-binding domain-containing protein [Xanthobacteraceae bacterium]|jgi:hypothetical protein|nr:Arm DNA-binding domain-containing protein [Xanthobacteraceae bacterium]
MEERYADSRPAHGTGSWDAKPEKGKFVKRLLDGAGLYLQATRGKGGVNRNWIFRYEMDGERHDLGIGPLHDFGLAKAREIALDFRQEIKAGIDPIQKRIADKRERLAKNAEQVKATAFEQCAEAYYKIHHKGWKNEKHRQQWLSTMRDYVYPVIGNLNG